MSAPEDAGVQEESGLRQKAWLGKDRSPEERRSEEGPALDIAQAALGNQAIARRMAGRQPMPRLDGSMDFMAAQAALGNAALVRRFARPQSALRPTPERAARSAPESEVLGVSDTLPLAGPPREDPRYIESTTLSIGIPIWGGPLYLKQSRAPGWADSVVVHRDDVAVVDPHAKQAVEIRQVYKTREAALAAVRRFGTEGAYSYYQGPMGRILPTIISATTAPGLTEAARLAIENERRDAKAAEKLGVALLLWYVGARYPAKASEVETPKQAARAAPAAGEATPSLATVLGEGEYAALKAAAEAAKVAHPRLGALTIDEIIALRAYTAESWKYINAALRLKDAKELKRLGQFISLMKSGLAKLPVFKGSVTRTFGMQVAEAAQKFRVGATVVEDGFTSATFGKAVAQREGNVLVTIESSAGHDVTSLAMFEESEVLFAPGARFLVIRVLQQGQAFLVWMKEVL